MTAIIRPIALAACAAVVTVGVPSGHAQSTNPASWRGDIRVLLAAMDSIHPNPYRRHSRAEWEAAAAELEGALPSLRYHEAVAGLARLVALAADGHTRLDQVRLQGHTQVQLTTLPGPGFEAMYPVLFEIFSDGLYVLRADARYRALFGGRVMAINGRATSEAVEALRPLISADNEMWFLYLLPQHLRTPAFLHAARLALRIEDPLTLTVADARGALSEVVVQAVNDETGVTWLDADEALGPRAQRPLFQRLTANYALTYLPERRTAYVRYRQMQHQESDSLPRFAERLFRFVDSAEVDRLVIDVRRNGGGNNYLNQPLVHGLIANRKINQPGKLFVITDRGTFSAAISFVAEVERNTHALFVGEPIGAGPNHYGDSRRVTLPASSLVVRISSLYWQHSDARDPRAWILPDLPAPESFADFLAHRDPALEAIFAYRGDTAAPRAPNTNWGRESQRRDLAPFVRW